ncbi:hypothetical protein EBR21_05035 [bacterium]|nr:hypothetical protein [bacterium]
MKRIFSFLLILCLVQTQAWARSKQDVFEPSFSNLVRTIANGGLNQDEIIEQAKKYADEIRDSGASEKEFVQFISEKLSLNMSEDEVSRTIDEARANPSIEKINSLAKQISEVKSGDKEGAIFLIIIIPLVALLSFYIGFYTFFCVITNTCNSQHR